MANEDKTLKNIEDTVQESSNDILECITNSVVDIKKKERKQHEHQTIENDIRDTKAYAEEEKWIYTHHDKDKSNIPKVSYGVLEDRRKLDTDHGTKPEKEEIGTTYSKHAHNTTGALPKYSYLESRLKLYAHLNRRTEGSEKTVFPDDSPSLKSMMTEYTNCATKGQQISQAKNKSEKPVVKQERDTDGNMHSLRMESNVSEVNVVANHLGACANSYGRLQDQSINALQSEFISVCIPNDTTDAKVKVKADELKGKLFPKFSNIQKKKTRYGKVKIYYNGELDKNEQKRIVKEAEDLLIYVKEKENEEKKLSKEIETEKENIGTRIRNFFRYLFCCKCCNDE